MLFLIIIFPTQRRALVSLSYAAHISLFHYYHFIMSMSTSHKCHLIIIIFLLLSLLLLLLLLLLFFFPDDIKKKNAKTKNEMLQNKIGNNTLQLKRINGTKRHTNVSHSHGIAQLACDS